MSALSIQPTYPIFTDIDGQPLEDGYVWIGTANLDPQTNPINVYWDAALTLPAAQPIRTLAGYPANSGTPARLYVNSDYSIRVMNKNGSVVYSAPAATERYSDVVVSGVNAEDVIYDPPFLGGVQTNVEEKLAQTVSVKDFGAVGDGVTDDTAAIHAATNTSKSVFFPPGTYKISGSSVGWDSVNDVCMFGAGWESKIVRFDVGSVVEIQNSTRAVVRDLYVQGVKTYNAAAGGIDLLNCSYFSVVGNYVTASSRQGINIEACSEGLVSNNHVTDSWQDGIMVRSGSRRVTVTGNVVWENGEPTFAPPVGEGIHVYESQEIAVVGNTVKGNKDNGITLEGADYTTVTGNVIYGQVVSGVSVNNATGYSGVGAVITGNVIKDNGAFGVVVTRVSDGILSDNVIAENASEGISIGISSNPADVQERWSVSGNRITNNTNYGVLVNWYSSKNRISGNIIDQPVGNALTVVRAECSSNIVHDNTITAGAITDSGTETRIYDNDLGQKLSGRVTLVAGASTITFSTNMPNSQYVVVLEGSANETFFTFNKLVSGFEIRSSNAASTAQVRWRIVDQKAI